MVFGNAFDKVLTPMPLLELKWFKQFGKIYGYFTFILKYKYSIHQKILRDCF
jgi:hypothetical protein